MSVAALSIAIVGVILAASSLTWNIVLFLLQGARPRVTAIMGAVTADGNLIVGPALPGMVESITRTLEQFGGPMVVGVEVTNAGRAPLHIHKWSVKAEPFGATLVPLNNGDLGAETPCDITPGATQSFVMNADQVRAMLAASTAADQRAQRVVCTVSSGTRTYRTKPIPVSLLA